MYYGDISESGDINWKVTSRDTTLVPASFSDTPTLTCYRDGNSTPSDSGVTFTKDYNSTPGFNDVSVDTSILPSFYLPGYDYTVKFLSGTVDSINVSGEIAGAFSIQNRYKQDLTYLQSGIDNIPTVSELEARTIPSGDYFNWPEDSDFSSLETYIDGRTLPSGDYFNTSEDTVDVGAVLGTSLTESNSGDFANNISQFFDVSPTTTKTVDDVGGVSSLTTSGIADAVWDEQLTGHMTPGSAGESLKYANPIVVSGSVNSDGNSNNFFYSNLGPVDNLYDDALVSFISGSLAGQTRIATAYNGTFGVFTFDEVFADTPASGDNFIVLRSHAHTRSQIADAIWDETTTGHTFFGTFGTQLKTVLDDVPTTSEFNARTLPSGEYNSGSGGGDATLANQESIIALLNYESGVIDNIYDDTNELQQNQSAWLTADISSLATTIQLNERTLPSGDYFNPTEDIVAHVTLVDTTANNTDMVDISSLATTVQLNERTLPSGDYFQWEDADLTSITTPLADIPTNSEFQARTLPSGDYFNAAEDSVTVDLSSITTLLNDMPTNAQLEARTLPSGSYLEQNDISSLVIETQGNYTLQQTLSIILSVLAGESEGSGLIFKTPDGNATRVTAVVDSDRNRTSMILDPS